MTWLLWFVFGLWLALVEGWARANFVAFPDPRVLVVVFLFLRTDRHLLAPRVLGVALAASAFDADPMGLWLAGLAVAAAILLPVRRNVRVDHWATVLLAAGVVVTSVLCVRLLAVSWGSAPLVEWSAGRWASLALTAGLAPLFNASVVRASCNLPLVPVIAPCPSEHVLLRDNCLAERVRR